MGMPRGHKNWLRRILAFRFLFLINLVIFGFLSWSFGREFLRNRQIQQDISALQTQPDTLQARNLEVTRLHTALQTESSIEREARLKLGLKKPGEHVVVIRAEAHVDHLAVTAGGATDPFGLLGGNGTTHVANPLKWWYYFFHRDAFDRLLSYGK